MTPAEERNRAWIGTVTPMTPEKVERFEAWRSAGGRASAHYWMDDEGEVEMGRRIEMEAPTADILMHGGFVVHGWVV